jgi:acyl-CoA synthetase (AMP-forming)/AMP-acid ligase II
MSSLVSRLLDESSKRETLTIGVVSDPITLAEAFARAATIAREILAADIKPEDKVAIIDSSSTGYVISWLACLLARIPVALINPIYPEELLQEMLAELQPKFIWRSEDVSRHRNMDKGIVTGLPGFNSEPLEVISYMHTSGTTGLPKFCAQSNSYFVNLARDMGNALELTANDRVLAPLPLFHINPMGYGVVTAILSGCDVFSLEKFSASGFWPTVKQNDISVLILHAPPVEILKRSTTTDDASGHKIRTMFYANRDFMETFDIPTAVSGYGSTEAGGISHIKQWPSAIGMPDNASRYGGPSRPNIEWNVNSSGDIFVRETEAGTLFSGYTNSQGVNLARDSDGWFDTGDIGKVDDSGDLIFIERGAESIRVKGEFVPIPTVEDRISPISVIEDFAIWKRPGELVDEEVVLYVVADEIPAAIITKAVSDLPNFMKPVAVARIAMIPRDAAAGKVQRRLLPDQEVLEWQSL